MTHEIGLTNLRAAWREHPADGSTVLHVGPMESEQGYYLSVRDAAEIAAFIVRTVGKVAQTQPVP